jgi:hypothetical protein
MAAKLMGTPIKAPLNWAVLNDRGISVGLTFELAKEGKAPSVPVKATRPEYKLYGGDPERFAKFKIRLRAATAPQPVRSAAREGLNAMIERVIILGEPATIAYLNARHEPATAADCTVAKVLFDSGKLLWLVKSIHIDTYRYL